MNDSFFKKLASIYMISELIKNAREETDRINQEEYEERNDSFALAEQDRKFGGHFETKNGRWDGDLVWLESQGPIPYILPRYVSVKQIDEESILICVDILKDRDALEEYECFSSTYVE
jgi:hypothetical protein